MPVLPSYLKKYVVQQNCENYTKENHQTWRSILLKLKSFLSTNAHSSYLKGLEQTGITIDSIPKISDIDHKLQKFGWGAVGVSGFIPPKAFMEFQLNNFLPIAVEIRQSKNKEYTPAPDIVHEAAGHTPFLIEPAFNSFLKKYAKVVRKSIIDKKDLKQYEAIRRLSDIKENPRYTAKDIKQAEQELEAVNKEMGEPSEAALLSRFIWWTSEYGLIGDLKNYKIYGAGLLSSIGESKRCFTAKVKKIPLTAECINYSYDITSFQPQLFVTPSFEVLQEVLAELKKNLAYYQGGVFGLKRAVKSETLCTVQLDSGVQISGIIKNYLIKKDCPAFIKFTGSSQISFKDKELPGQGKTRHKEGFSAPLGPLKSPRLLENIAKNKGPLKLEFSSGFVLEGECVNSISQEGKLLVLTFKNCTVFQGSTMYFKPEWGEFDLALGSQIVSVFGGPADRSAFGDL